MGAIGGLLGGLLGAVAGAIAGPRVLGVSKKRPREGEKETAMGIGAVLGGLGGAMLGAVVGGKEASAAPQGVTQLTPGRRYSITITGQTQAIDPATLQTEWQKVLDMKLGAGVVRVVSISQTGGAGAPIVMVIDWHGAATPIGALQKGELAQATIVDIGPAGP